MKAGRSLESLILSSQLRAVRLFQIKQAATFARDGKVRAIKGPCDFMGFHVPTLTPLVIDAKSCAVPTRFVCGEPHFPKHQRDHLIAWGQDGAVAGAIVERSRERMLYWLNWTHVHDHDLPPSLPWNDSRLGYIGNSDRLVDWVALLMTAAANRPSTGGLRR